MGSFRDDGDWRRSYGQSHPQGEFLLTQLVIHTLAMLWTGSWNGKGGAHGQAETTAAGALILSSSVRPQHAGHAAPEALGLVDAGLMSGHSFRVGWALGGRFAQAGDLPPRNHASRCHSLMYMVETRRKLCHLIQTA